MKNTMLYERSTDIILNENYVLSNGVKIPKLGLGTWLIDDDKAAEAVRQAVKLGCRHIDTAQTYENERAYVLDGESRIDMTSIVHEDRTYIKVQGFEKLGCIVDYEEDEDGWCIATVIKPR